VRNITTTAQTNVVSTDAILAHTTYVAGSASVTQGSVNDSGPIVANIGTLNAGEYAVLTFRVKVKSDAVGLPVTNQASATSSQPREPVYTDPTPPYPGPYDFPDPGPEPVKPAIRPPVAVDDMFAVPESVPAQLSSTLDVLANDSDPNGRPLTITQFSVPAHGAATTNRAAIIYTPTADYLGVDTFTYTISNGNLEATAQVTVTVSPVADPEVKQNISVTISGYNIVIVARNLGPRPAPGAVVSDTFPAILSNITWTCVGAGGAVCGAPSGSGNLLTDTLPSFPAGGGGGHVYRLSRPNSQSDRRQHGDHYTACGRL
jgi:hypothetical protein